MKRPECSSEMEEGEAYIRSTVLGFLFFGFSAQHCWFKPSGSGKEQVIVHNKIGYRSRKTDEAVNPPAWYCECGTTTVKRGKSIE